MESDNQELPHYKSSSNPLIGVMIVVALVLIVFYWFVIRPGNIRSDCLKAVRDEAVTTITREREPDGYKREKLQEQYMNNAYNYCLHEKGL